jgi:hypothetical protein
MTEAAPLGATCRPNGVAFALRTLAGEAVDLCP